MNVLQKSLDMLESLRTNLHNLKDVLDNSVPSSSFPEDTINTLKSQTVDLLAKTEAVILTPIDSQTMSGVK